MSVVFLESIPDNNKQRAIENGEEWAFFNPQKAPIFKNRFCFCCVALLSVWVDCDAKNRVIFALGGDSLSPSDWPKFFEDGVFFSLDSCAEGREYRKDDTTKMRIRWLSYFKCLITLKNRDPNKSSQFELFRRHNGERKSPSWIRKGLSRVRQKLSHVISGGTTSSLLTRPSDGDLARIL